MKETREDSDLTLKEIIRNFRRWIVYLLSNWKIYLAVFIIAITAAVCISKFSTRYYIAESNFVHESAGSSTDAGSLFAQLGFGGNSNAGLFNSNDNILWLYTSSSLITKALLEEVEIDNKKILLANYFLKFSPEIKKYYKQFPELKSIVFNKDISTFSRNENKLMRQCINVIKKKYLEVSSVSQTENIVNVRTKSIDENFSYYFNLELTDIVNQFYIATKTEQLNTSIKNLTKKADSVRNTLDRNMYQVASSVDQVPYLNPNLQALRVESQKKNVDVQMNSAIYMQLIQNIESTKLTLAQQMPIIRIVDRPVLPLSTQSVSMVIAVAIAAFLAIVLTSLYLVGMRIYKEAMAA